MNRFWDFKLTGAPPLRSGISSATMSIALTNRKPSMDLQDPIAVYVARNNIVLHQLTNMLNDAGIESYAIEDVSPGPF